MKKIQLSEDDTNRYLFANKKSFCVMFFYKKVPLSDKKNITR